MAYAQVTAENRLILFLAEDPSEEDFEELTEQFPVYFDNPELIFETAEMYSMEDFFIEDGHAYYDPTPETLAIIEQNRKDEEVREVVNQLPDTLDEMDEVLCALYEIMLYEQKIIDSQDEAICALYELGLGGE